MVCCHHSIGGTRKFFVASVFGFDSIALAFDRSIDRSGSEEGTGRAAAAAEFAIKSSSIIVVILWLLPVVSSSSVVFQ